MYILETSCIGPSHLRQNLSIPTIYVVSSDFPRRKLWNLYLYVPKTRIKDNELQI